MKKISDQVVTLQSSCRDELVAFVEKLSPYLPAKALVAVDFTINNGKMEIFHYVDGGADLKTLASLKNKKFEAGLVNATERFQINYEAGVAIGLWTQLDFFNHEKQINWDKGFIIKKASGKMVINDPILNLLKMNAEISIKTLRSKGASTRHDIIKFLHEPGANFYQPYHKPLCAPEDASRLATYRAILWKTEDEIVSLGGLWTSTPNESLRLKGVNDVKTGLIEV